MSIPIFEYRFTVPQAAIDELGHVNNVTYVQWMQDAAMAHSAALGADMAFYRSVGGVWVVRRHTIEYAAAAFAGERILIKTWVSTKERRRSLRKFIICRDEDRQVLALAETMWVFIDLKAQRAIPIPPEVGDRFTVVPPSAEPRP